jgi:type VI secretion system protein ImpC
MPELAGLTPRLDLYLGGSTEAVRLEFARLDDFHPDAMFRTLPLFAELLEARAAVKEGRESGFAFTPPPGEAPDAPPSAEQTEVPPSPPTPRPPSNDSGLLDAIVEETAPSTPGTHGPDQEIQDFVRSVVRPHLVRPAPDRTAELEAIDQAASALMRAVLHHEDFRALESLWRSLVFLLSRIDTTGKVRVYIVDVSRAELEDDLFESEDPTRSRLHALLTAPDQAPVSGRWALVVGAYAFGASTDDVSVLERLAQVARAADVPWLSEGDIRLTGCESLGVTPDPRDWSDPWAGEWSRIPKAPHAAWLGLALPRLLAREPYGTDLGPRCKTFDFEEEPESREEPEESRPTPGRALLWGNPAFLCAALLAQAFARDGWDFSTDAVLDVGQVTLARGAFADEQTPVLTEHRLHPAAAQQIARAGLMPLVAFPHEARIRLGGIRPVAPPPARLRAWWNP